MSTKQLEVRRKFAEAARMCKAEVASLPKGQRLQAFRACISRKLRGGFKV